MENQKRKPTEEELSQYATYLLEQYLFERRPNPRLGLYEQEPERMLHFINHAGTDVSMFMDNSKAEHWEAYAAFRIRTAKQGEGRECIEVVAFIHRMLAEFEAHPECKTYADLKAAHEKTR